MITPRSINVRVCHVWHRLSACRIARVVAASLATLIVGSGIVLAQDAAPQENAGRFLLLFPDARPDQKMLEQADRIMFRVDIDHPGHDFLDPSTRKGPSDEDIAYISRAKNLTSLVIGGNDLTPEGLRPLRQLTKLRSLYYQRIPNGDAVLEEVSHWHSLEELLVPESQITNASAEYLARMKKLKRLNLDGAKIDDNFLSCHKLPDSLVELDIRDTQIGHKVVESLPRSIEDLTLSSPNLDEKCFAGIQKLDRLERLRISSPKLPARAIEQLRKLLPSVPINGERYGEN